MKTHKWQEIRDKMGPERCARLDAEAQKMLSEMPLNGLRSDRGLSRKTLSEALPIQQEERARRMRAAGIVDPEAEAEEAMYREEQVM
jgi:hypothetical protein